jgi:predicted amidohydrolase
MPRFSRRSFVGAGSVAAATGLGSFSVAAGTARPGGRAAAFAPLRTETPVFALVQSAAWGIDLETPEPDLERNLQRMLESIEAAQATGQRCDWIAFHDCPLTGRVATTAATRTRVAIEVGGEHFQRLAGAARRHSCWLSFGAWLRLPGARNEAFEANAFLSPAGELVSMQRFDGTVRSGSPWPEVVVTDIGNLAATPRADDPAHHAALVAAGAEFVLRTSSGPLADWALDMPVCCRAHGIHGAIVNAAAGTRSFPAIDPSGGGTAFFGPDGRRLAAAEGSDEQILRWAVPIGAQRRSAAAPA